MNPSYERIVKDYVPLARKLAKEYTPRGRHYRDDDFLSVAYEGLCRAVSRLDMDREGRTSFIRKTIEGALKTHLRNTLRPPIRGLDTKEGREYIMTRDPDCLPEETAELMAAAFEPTLSLNEPEEFDDGEKGQMSDRIVDEHATDEEGLVERDRTAYIRREMNDWVSGLEGLEKLIALEVLLGDKSLEQFRKDHRKGWDTVKAAHDALLERAHEELSYILFNLGEEV